jgi:hypothetical protein
MGFYELFAWAGFKPISASQVAKTIDVSHWYVAFGFCFLKIYITLQNKDS